MTVDRVFAGLVVLLASACVMQTAGPPAARIVAAEDCDDPVPGPGKLPPLLTTQTLRAWADKTDEAREENAKRLRACGRRLRKVTGLAY